MAQGYGKFAGIGGIAVPWFAGTTMFTKLPAFRNAHPARHWPPPDNLAHGGPRVKNEEGPPPEGESDEPCFPLMVFSHGLGGTRTAYSSLCGEVSLHLNWDTEHVRLIIGKICSSLAMASSCVL